MDGSSGQLAATVLDVEPWTMTVEYQEGALVAGANYLVDDGVLRFLAAKVMWVRGSKAGLFFKHSIHPDTMDRLRPSDSREARVGLRQLP